jgi:hypothetical protein
MAALNYMLCIFHFGMPLVGACFAFGGSTRGFFFLPYPN